MTPEERHDAQVTAMWKAVDANQFRSDSHPAQSSYDALLAYFDNTEPAVADAIRYGLKPSGDRVIKFVHYRRKDARYGSVFEQAYVADTPLELCTWGDCCAEELSLTSTSQENNSDSRTDE